MGIDGIQKQLAACGFGPGPIDGIWGRQTIAALRAFQQSRGLAPSGVLDPPTLAALTPAGSTAEPVAVWLQEAMRLIGTHEAPGAASNPAILGWAKGEGIVYRGDDIPWCGLFVGHCIAATLDREPLPANPLGARNWAGFGVPAKPVPGAILVFWRGAPQSGLGHVGFHAGEDATAYRVLGGNQSDAVSFAWVAKQRLVAARWPATAAPPTPAAPLTVTRGEALSWNEA